MKKYIVLITLIIAICITITSCAKKEVVNQTIDNDAEAVEEHLADKDAESDIGGTEKQSAEIICKTNEPILIDGKAEITFTGYANTVHKDEADSGTATLEVYATVKNIGNTPIGQHFFSAGGSMKDTDLPLFYFSDGNTAKLVSNAFFDETGDLIVDGNANLLMQGGIADMVVYADMQQADEDDTNDISVMFQQGDITYTWKIENQVDSKIF